jgi:oxygen-dependent protoporphyrinogen oxidase
VSDADRIIVGAGMSGLLAARRAVALGESVLIIEDGPRSGGLIQPVSLDGLLLDAGAEAFSVAGESCMKLAGELNMGDRVVSPHRSDARIVFSQDQRYRIPHGVLGIPSSLDDPELLDIISPEGMEIARTQDALPPGFVEDLSVADVVEQRLGIEFVEKLVDPMFAGVHGSSAGRLQAQATIPALLKAMQDTGSLCAAVASVRSAQPRPGAAVASIEGGLFYLVHALEQDLLASGVSFLFETGVTALEKTSAGWTLDSETGTYSSQHLTLAAGVDQASRLLSGLVPSRSFSLESSAVDVALVILEVESVELNSFPLGSGALVAEAADVEAKATTHVNAKWEWLNAALPQNRHIIRLSYGRNGVLPSGDLIELATGDVSALYGVQDLQMVSSTLVEWPGSLFQANSASQAAIAGLIDIAKQFEIELCGSYISGNGLLGITKDHYQRMTS